MAEDLWNMKGHKEGYFWAKRKDNLRWEPVLIQAGHKPPDMVFGFCICCEAWEIKEGTAQKPIYEITDTNIPWVEFVPMESPDGEYFEY